MRPAGSRPRPARLTIGAALLAVAVIAPAVALRRPQAASPAPPGRFKFTNKLAGASSPYLLEHAHNPVNWYPWGDEALAKAKRENKPIFLSVGYSACHWCHVMAREDFENEEIAAILNAGFVSIKVDREQRPDIDSQYMLALQLMTGSGGWPMSLFLTPDGKPFFGGTFYPPADFKLLLARVAEVYAKQPEAVRAQADKVRAAVAEASAPGRGGTLPGDVVERAIEGIRRRFDRENGGFSKRPKFPEAPILAFLLARYGYTGDRSILAMATTTLDRMAGGGIFDQLGGGFHRYSTDPVWRTPHFEKMLYDQAQLVMVYLEAYRITRKPLYRRVVEETLDFVSREMRDRDGGFTSTIDADSEGQEGRYYLWTLDEIRQALGPDAPLFCKLYGVTAAGDLDGRSVLHLAAPDRDAEASARRQAIPSPPKLGAGGRLNESAEIASMRARLLAVRSRRVRPRTDDKVLASWNGLMIAAYARADAVLGDPKYRRVAVDAARFLTRSMVPDGRLRHCYHAGTAEIPGLLEDYADCAYGLLELAAATHDATWTADARTLLTQMVAGFADGGNGGFYSTPATSAVELLVRQKEGEDNATPSANGIAALALLRLAEVTGDQSCRSQALRAVQAFQSVERRAPSAFPTLLTAYQSLGRSAGEAAAPIVAISADALQPAPGGEATVTVRLRVKQGWHINAHRASARTLIATTLSASVAEGVKLLSVEYPPGRSARLQFSAERLAVYEGDLALKARLRIAQSARGPLRLSIRYQACDNRSCLPPDEKELRIPLANSH